VAFTTQNLLSHSRPWPWPWVCGLGLACLWPWLPGLVNIPAALQIQLSLTQLNGSTDADDSPRCLRLYKQQLDSANSNHLHVVTKHKTQTEAYMTVLTNTAQYDKVRRAKCRLQLAVVACNWQVYTFWVWSQSHG